MACIKKIHLKIVGYFVLGILLLLYMCSSLAVLISSFFISDYPPPQWAEIAPGICIGMWAIAIGVLKKNKKKVARARDIVSV